MDKSHLKLSQEVDTLRETLTPIERELRGTKMELQDAIGNKMLSFLC